MGQYFYSEFNLITIFKYRLLQIIWVRDAETCLAMIKFITLNVNLIYFWPC